MLFNSGVSYLQQVVRAYKSGSSSFQPSSLSSRAKRRYDRREVPFCRVRTRKDIPTWRHAAESGFRGRRDTIVPDSPNSEKTQD